MGPCGKLADMLVDLSHIISHGVVTHSGLPAPQVSAFMNREPGRYSDGTSFHIARIEMVANTGTYVDAPFHRFEDGDDIAAIALARLADVPGVVIEGTELPDGDLRGRAVLFRTGWSRHFGTEHYRSGRHPFLTRAVADELVNRQPALVGIDSMNIDDTSDGERPVHTILLRAGIPLVEHLAHLDELPTAGFRFFAAPAKFAGLGTFMVRAFAIV